MRSNRPAHLLATAFLLLLVMLAAPLRADPVPKHRIVVDVTGATPASWAGAVSNVENLLVAFGPGTQIEVVGRGGGIGLLQASDTHEAERMKKLADAGVVFAACRNSMRARNLRKEDLVPFATTVDSGAAEVVRKQEEGWSYLKTAD